MSTSRSCVVGYSAGRIPALDNGRMDQDAHAAYEAALRRLPLAHSLALRLRDAGADDEVICSYLHIEPEGLATLLLIAERKLEYELRAL